MARAGVWPILWALALAGAARAAPGQEPPCGPPPPTKRALAEGCVAQLERTSTSPTANATERARAAQQLARLQARLRDGDFRPGDRIYLLVRGESTLTDTLTVQTGPAVNVQGIGAIPLRGVLRGDLQSYLSDTLATYIKDPTVEASALVRLSVVGEVARPGFYAVPANAALADVIMVAGGLTQDAKARSLRVERGSARLWDAGRLQDALASRQTVADLGLHEGDRIVVPRAGRGSLDTVLRITGVLLTIPAAIWGLHATGIM